MTTKKLVIEIAAKADQVMEKKSTTDEKASDFVDIVLPALEKSWASGFRYGIFWGVLIVLVVFATQVYIF